MTTRASDTLARIFARLAPQSPQAPGKPAKKPRKGKKGGSTTLPDGVKLRTLDMRAELYRALRLRQPHPTDPTKTVARDRFAGALSFTRCGATQTQSRSVRLGGESTGDLACSLSAVKDPVSLALVIFTAIPNWRLKVGALLLDLRQLLLERAVDLGQWPSLAERHVITAEEFDDTLAAEGFAIGDAVWSIDGLMARRLVHGVLRELGRADACRACQSTPGKVLDLTASPPQWVTCRICLGTTRTRLGVEKRAKLLKIRSSTFRGSDLRLAYEWLLADCYSRLDTALAEIREYREGEE